MSTKTIIINLFIIFSLTTPVLASDYINDCKNSNINACNQWIEEEPSSEAYAYRAIAKAKNQDLEGAMVDYNQAIKLNPNDFMSYINRADLKKFFEEYDSAIADLDKAIELEPNNPDLYKKRSEIKKLAGDTSGAREDSNKAQIHQSKISKSEIDNQKQNTSLEETNSIQTLMKQCKNLHINSCNKWVQLEPNNEVAYYERAKLKRKSGDKLGALKDYNNALQIKPNYIFAKTGRDEMQGSKEFRKEIVKYDENSPQITNYITDCKKLNINSCALWIQEQPFNAKAYYTRANTKRKLNDPKGALDDYNKTIELDNKFYKAYYWRSFLESKL